MAAVPRQDVGLSSVGGSGDEENGPSLDPVPQELQASIEVCFTAAIKPYPQVKGAPDVARCRFG